MTHDDAALVIATPGPGRRTAAKVLRRLGFAVRTASEPFEGTARFVEQPARLVVISLAAWRARDAAFLKAVRRRSPNCRVILLVPEGRREAARHALTTGADAWLPEPCYVEELRALVKALVPPIDEGIDLDGEAGRAVRLLAREVAHAVNNPLQVLRLLGEDKALSERTAGALVGQVDRIRDAVKILEAFTRLGRPHHVEGRPGEVLRQSLREAETAGSIVAVSPPPADGVLTTFDPRQLRYALDCAIDVLGACSRRSPLPVKAAVHRLTPRQGRALGRRARRALKRGRWIELALKGRDVDLDAERVRDLEGRVIWNHEDTRRAHPGLAAVSLVARRHAGRLLARPAAGGMVLGIALPVP